MTSTLQIDPRCDSLQIGLLSISDRASGGVYADQGIPALKNWLSQALWNPIDWQDAVIPDEAALITSSLLELVNKGCHLILTTGGTGPSPRDVTPEATLAVQGREMPGFGEQMRQISLHFVHLDFFPVTRQGLISRVVQHLLHNVQRVIGSGVHARTLFDGFQTLQNANGVFRIFGDLLCCHG
jgi:molybdenum cofactor synthesis domain-containing protein